MREHKNVLFGNESGHGVAAKRRKAWDAAGVAVNAISKVDRGQEKEMRAKWNDLTHRAKNYHKKRLGRQTGERLINLVD